MTSYASPSSSSSDKGASPMILDSLASAPYSRTSLPPSSQTSLRRPQRNLETIGRRSAQKRIRIRAVGVCVCGHACVQCVGGWVRWRGKDGEREEERVKGGESGRVRGSTRRKTLEMCNCTHTLHTQFHIKQAHTPASMWRQFHEHGSSRSRGSSTQSIWKDRRHKGICGRNRPQFRVPTNKPVFIQLVEGNTSVSFYTGAPAVFRFCVRGGVTTRDKGVQCARGRGNGF